MAIIHENIKSRPEVVIAGRPNVGKSTLFNRLFGKRRAITDPTPGVTRDLIRENCVINGIPVVLTDTGGVKAECEDVFDSLVSDLSLSTLESADIIPFLVEIGTLSAEDELIIERLRPYSEKVILVVNKADTAEKEYEAAEFYSLGLGEPFPVSSAHNRNIQKLVSLISDKLKVAVQNYSPDSSTVTEHDLILALVGRPNAGKSTLANSLSGKPVSLVSEVAGTTRDTVIGSTEHKGRNIKIIDTAGMRRKARVKENVEYYSVNRAVKAMFEADVTVLLVDSEEGLSEQDKKITAQAVKKGRTVIIALNKWDEKIPDQKKLGKAVDRIRFQFPVLSWAPVIPVSALKGYGITKLLDTVVKADSQQNKRIETSELNKAVSEWIDFTPPPTKKGKQFKIKYVTQVSIKPVRFVAFVNRKSYFPEAYVRFLVNQIRKEFGFSMVPVEMELREGKK